MCFLDNEPTVLPVDGTVTGVVASLSGEALSAAKVIDLTKQDLKHAVRDTRSVAGQLVTSKASGVEGQATLSSPDTLNTSASERAPIILRVVRCVERGDRVLRQTLSAVPGHVLNSKQSTVGAKEHIEVSRANNGVVGELDDTLENAISGRTRRRVRSAAAVVTVPEDIDVSALEPVGVDISV